MRKLLVCMMALAAAVACGGEPPDAGREPGVSPERLGRSGWFCPDGYDIVGLDELFYPQAHPLRPVIRPRPDRCFASEDEARRAGFELAAPPEGGLVVDGVYLVPADFDLRVECQQHATRLGIAVACPGLVPNDPGSLYVWSSPDWEEFRLESGFQGPPGYEGVDGPGAHLWILSVRSDLIGDEVCSLPTAGGRTIVRGRGARWIECGEASEFNGGHVVLRWMEEGVTYEVSFHGVNQTNRRLALAIAEGLVLVTP